MSDAKNRLQEALNKAKSKKVPKAPVVSARKPSAPQRQSQAPAPKKTEAPKKKASRQPKKSAPGAGSGLFKNLQSFASTVIDELKTATAEIAPGALLATANDGIKSLRKAMSAEKGTEDAPATESTPQVPAPDNARPQSAASAASPPAARTASAASPQKEQPIQYTSPAKVQRVGSKKKTDEEPESPAQTESAPQVTAAPPSESHGAPQTEFPETPTEFTSPAKVQRVGSKKKTDEGESPAQEKSASVPAADHTPPAEIAFEPPEQAHQAMTSPAKVQRTGSRSKAADEEAPGAVSESPMYAQEISVPSSAQAETSPKISGGSGETAPPEPPEKKKPVRPTRQPLISKEEQAVRTFRALQTVLTNAIWLPVTTDLTVKPSSLYAPRAQFDANFGNPAFREGLKAASRLAGISALPPDKVNFNPKTIQQVIGFNTDPQEKIKPHTEILTSVLDEDTVKKILAMMQDKPVKYLLFSVGTRLGSFVPTLEMLARIYLGMRKKEPINAGDRLKIQADILMRYQKAPYTEETAQKARNLAVNYFLDYLSDYAIKEYKEGQKTAPRSLESAESQQRRHAALIASCANTVDEWAQKLALPATAVNNVKMRFQEAADTMFRQTAESSVSAPNHGDQE